MGQPTFFFYTQGGILQTLTFPAAFAVDRLRLIDTPRGAQEETASRVVTAVRARSRRVQINIPPSPRSEAQSTYELLSVLFDHLRRGGTCGFAEDGDRAWLSYLLIPASFGATSLLTTGSVPYSTGATLASGGQLKLETWEGGQLYVDTLSTAASVSAGGKVVTLARGVRYGLSTAGWLRSDGYFPALRLELGDDPEDNDRWLRWGWSATFKIDQAQLVAGPDYWRSLYTGTSPYAAAPSVAGQVQIPGRATVGEHDGEVV